MITAAALWLASEAFARPRVVVVQSDDLGPYTDPVPAFLEAIGEPALVVNLHGHRAEADALIERLKHEESPKVVFCLGAKAAYAVRHGLPDVPMIYTAIVDPARYGIRDDGHTWGVAATADPLAYLSQMQAFFPDVKQVGWMRGPSVPDSKVEELRDAASAVGVNLVVEKIDSPQHLRKELDTLAPKIDALWVPADRNLLSTETFRLLTDESRRRHLPLLVPTDNMVRAGALFVVPDPKGVGGIAAAEAIEILEGRSPEQAVMYPDTLRVALNLRTLALAAIPFDKLLLDFVDEPIQ